MEEEDNTADAFLLVIAFFKNGDFFYIGHLGKPRKLTQASGLDLPSSFLSFLAMAT